MRVALAMMWVAAASGQPAASAEKTAAEVYKNVMVLRETPRGQFLSTMTLISGSLGVPCTYCHTQPFESDSKPAKVAARKMIQMTMDINAKNFGGKSVVTCNTCHQGSVHANGLAGLWNKTPPQIAEFKREEEPARAPASPDEVLPSADQILANYRKAVGGDQATSMHLEGFITSDLTPRPRVIDSYAVFPDRMMFGISFAGVQSKLLIHADHAWGISPQGVQELPLAQARTVMDLLQPVRFISSDAKAEFRGIERIDGRPYYCVVSTTAASVKWLYFDKQSGLLFKIHSEYPTPLGPEPVETIFGEYSDVSGVKMPFSITHSSVTDRTAYRFSKIEMNIAVDPARFDPPPAKQ